MLIPDQLIGIEPKKKKSGGFLSKTFDAVRQADAAIKAMPAPKRRVETAYGTFEVETKATWNKRNQEKYREMLEDQGREEGWERVDGTTGKIDFTKTTPEQYERAKKAVNPQSRPSVIKTPAEEDDTNPAFVGKVQTRMPNKTQSRIDAFDQSRIDPTWQEEYTGGNANLLRSEGGNPKLASADPSWATKYTNDRGIVSSIPGILSGAMMQLGGVPAEGVYNEIASSKELDDANAWFQFAGQIVPGLNAIIGAEQAAILGNVVATKGVKAAANELTKGLVSGMNFLDPNITPQERSLRATQAGLALFALKHGIKAYKQTGLKGIEGVKAAIKGTGGADRMASAGEMRLGDLFLHKGADQLVDKMAESGALKTKAQKAAVKKYWIDRADKFVEENPGSSQKDFYDELTVGIDQQMPEGSLAQAEIDILGKSQPKMLGTIADFLGVGYYVHPDGSFTTLRGGIMFPHIKDYADAKIAWANAGGGRLSKALYAVIASPKSILNSKVGSGIFFDDVRALNKTGKIKDLTQAEKLIAEMASGEYTVNKKPVYITPESTLDEIQAVAQSTFANAALFAKKMGFGLVGGAKKNAKRLADAGLPQLDDIAESIRDPRTRQEGNVLGVVKATGGNVTAEAADAPAHLSYANLAPGDWATVAPAGINTGDLFAPGLKRYMKKANKLHQNYLNMTPEEQLAWDVGYAKLKDDAAAKTRYKIETQAQKLKPAEAHYTHRLKTSKELQEVDPEVLRNIIENPAGGFQTGGNTLDLARVNRGMTDGQAPGFYPAEDFGYSMTPGGVLKLDEKKILSIREVNILNQSFEGDVKGWYDRATKTMGFLTGKSDFSTIMHESFHAWTDGLTQAHKDVLAKHFGEIGSTEWYEGSARAFEKYVLTGDVADTKLGQVFEAIKTAIKSVVDKLTGTKAADELNPEVRRVFDEMLGRDKPKVDNFTPDVSGIQGMAVPRYTPGEDAQTVGQVNPAKLGAFDVDETGTVRVGEGYQPETRYERQLNQGSDGTGKLDARVHSDGRRFRDQLESAKRDHPFGVAVDVKEPEFYTNPNTKLFTTEDELGGVAVTEDGDLVSVFKHPSRQGNINDVLAVASREAKTLDAYDINGQLPNLYARHGFRPAARIRFNAEYAPEGWDAALMGEPDIVFMVRDVDGTSGLPEIPEMADGGYKAIMDQIPVFDDYDEAADWQKGFAAMRESAAEPASGTVTPPEPHFTDGYEPKGMAENVGAPQDLGINDLQPKTETGIPVSTSETALANRITAEIRLREELGDRTAPDPETMKSWAKEAESVDVDELIDRIETAERPTATAPESLAVGARISQIQDEINDLEKQYQSAVTKGSIPMDLYDKMDSARKRLVQTIEVSERIGTEAARTMVARRALLKADYSFAGLIQKQMKVAEKNGVKPSEADIARVEVMSKQIKDLEDKLAALEKQAPEALSEKAARQALKKETLDKEEASIIDEIKAIAQAKPRNPKMRGNQAGAINIGKSAEYAPLIKRLVKVKIQKGFLTVDTLFSEITEAIKGFDLVLAKQDFIDLLDEEIAGRKASRAQGKDIDARRALNKEITSQSTRGQEKAAQKAQEKADAAAQKTAEFEIKKQIATARREALVAERKAQKATKAEERTRLQAEAKARRQEEADAKKALKESQRKARQPKPRAPRPPMTEAQRAERLQKQIDELNKKAADGSLPLPEKQKLTPLIEDLTKQRNEALKNAKANSTAYQGAKAQRDAERLAEEPVRQLRADVAEIERLRGRKEDLDKMLRDKEFYGIGREKRVSSLQDQKDLLEMQIKQLRRDADAEINSMYDPAWKKVMAEFVGIPRFLELGLDAGALMRQGWDTLFVDPKAWIKAAGSGTKAAFNPKFASKVESDFYNSPEIQKMVKEGLEIDGAGQHPEYFVTKALNWLPGYAGAERFHKTFQNVARAEMGKSITKMTKLSSSERKDAFHIINAMTGRGNNVAVKEATKLLGGVFTAPRMYAGQVEMMGKTLRVDKMKKNPAYLRLVGRRMVGRLGVIAGLYEIAQLTGNEFGIDPDKSNFLKLTVNGVVYDLGSGYTPYYRAILRSLNGLISDQDQDGVMDKDPGDILKSVFDVAKYKVNPAVQFVAGVARGKDGVGDPVFRGRTEGENPQPNQELDINADSMVGTFAPMIAQEIYSMLKSEHYDRESKSYLPGNEYDKASPEQKVASGVLSFAGGGVSAYNTAKKTKFSTSYLGQLAESLGLASKGGSVPEE